MIRMNIIKNGEIIDIYKWKKKALPPNEEETTRISFYRKYGYDIAIVTYRIKE